MSFFVFFDIEVFVFLGMLLGLWVWLSVKFLVNKLYFSGPVFSFKTDGVKTARDVLTRNKSDAINLVAVFWCAFVNYHLSIGSNYLSDRMEESQYSILYALYYMNVLQIFALIMLKFWMIQTPEERTEADKKVLPEDAKYSEIFEKRRRSWFDIKEKHQYYFNSKCRATFTFAVLSATFVVFPICMLGYAVYVQIGSGEEDDEENVVSFRSSPEREKITLISYWVFIVIVQLILFALVEIRPLISDLF